MHTLSAPYLDYKQASRTVLPGSVAHNAVKVSSAQASAVRMQVGAIDLNERRGVTSSIWNKQVLLHDLIVEVAVCGSLHEAIALWGTIDLLQRMRRVR